MLKDSAENHIGVVMSAYEVQISGHRARQSEYEAELTRKHIATSVPSKQDATKFRVKNQSSYCKL